MNKRVYRIDGTKLYVIHKWNPNYSTVPVIGSSVTESSLTKTETTDYLGITRIILNASGVKQQSVNYYPYGMQLGDATGCVFSRINTAARSIATCTG